MSNQSATRGPKRCDGCGETFQPKQRGREMRFCARRCRDGYWTRVQHPAPADRPCAVCGTTFTPAKYAGDRAKFCSASCRREGWEPVRRRSWLKKYYNISLERYDEMLATQGGRCAICGTDDPSPHQYLSVDHDHRTGEPRALLCNRCNVGIGRFGDDVELIAAALDYLRSHQ